MQPEPASSLTTAAFYGLPLVVMDDVLRRALGEQIERRRLVDARPVSLADGANDDGIADPPRAEHVVADPQQYRYD